MDASVPSHSGASMIPVLNKGQSIVDLRIRCGHWIGYPRCLSTARNDRDPRRKLRVNPLAGGTSPCSPRRCAGRYRHRSCPARRRAHLGHTRSDPCRRRRLGLDRMANHPNATQAGASTPYLMAAATTLAGLAVLAVDRARLRPHAWNLASRAAKYRLTSASQVSSCIGCQGIAWEYTLAPSQNDAPDLVCGDTDPSPTRTRVRSSAPLKSEAVL
jgi:hypothetical protein